MNKAYEYCYPLDNNDMFSIGLLLNTLSCDIRYRTGVRCAVCGVRCYVMSDTDT